MPAQAPAQRRQAQEAQGGVSAEMQLQPLSNIYN